VTISRTVLDSALGRVLIGSASLVLAIAILMPMGMTIFGAIRSDSPGMPNATFTWTNLYQVYGTLTALEPLTNTFLTCVPGTMIALFLGVVLAWLIQRTDAPGHRWLEAYLIAPIYFSPLALALGWVLLGAPRIGLINVLWPFSESIVNVYSYTGIILFIGLYFAPYVYLIISGTLRSLDAGYEDASAILGATPVRSFIKITLPMLRPQILASALLVFVICSSMFAEPMMFGARFHFTNMPIEIFSRIVSSPADYNLAASLGTMMLFIACFGLFLYRRALASGERFVTTQSRGFVVRRVSLGRMRPFAGAFLTIYMAMIVILPIIALVVTSFQRFIGPRFRLDVFGLRNYAQVFNDAVVIQATINTLLLSAGVATVCTIFGLLCAYHISRRELPGGWLIDAISILPIGVPAVVLSVGFLWAYLWFPIGIYGTVWALLLALVTVVIPNTIRNLDAALRQLGTEVEFAARMLGAGTSRRIFQIVLPMLAGPLLSGWLFAFMLTAIQVSVPIMLRSPGQEMLSVSVWSLALENGRFGEASVVALIQAVIAGLVVVVARWVSSSREVVS
jgi:iron(III) transport system permease protein